MRIEKEFNCLGYFGFGSGISMARDRMANKRESAYCNGCVLAQACWQAHRARVHQTFPDIAKHIEDLARQKEGNKKIVEYIKNKGVDPFSSMMLGNIEDGILVVHKGTPKDRGQFSLPYPFK